MQSYQESKVWQQAMDLAALSYRITKAFVFVDSCFGKGGLKFGEVLGILKSKGLTRVGMVSD